MWSIYVHAYASFANLVQTEDWIKDGVKIRKIKDYQTRFEQSLHGTGGSTKKIFYTPRIEKAKKRFIRFQTTHPDISSPLIILFLFIVYLQRLLYFQLTLIMPCILHYLSTIPSNRTYLIAPKISVIRRVIPSKTRIKFLESLPPFRTIITSIPEVIEL